MLNRLTHLAVLGFVIQLASPSGAQQLPTPHTSSTPAAHHTGGLGRFGGGPDTVVASLDGRFFAMNDGSIWSVAAGGVIGELGKRLRIFYLSASGTWLAFAEANSVKVWTLASGEIREFAQLDEPVELLTGSPDGTMLIAVTRHGGPELFQVASGTRLRKFVWSSERPQILDQDAAVAFSPDARLLACGSEVWTVATGISMLQMQGSFKSFANDGRSLLGLVGNHTIEEWDLSTRERSSMFDLPGTSSDRFVFRPDGRVGVLSQPLNSNQLTLWDTYAGLQTGVVRVPSITGGYRVAFLGSSDWLIAGNQHNLPRLVRISTGEEIATLDSDGKKWSVVRTSDGAYDASADVTIIGPRQSSGMNVDGIRIEDGHLVRVAGLLNTLPGSPAANPVKPRPGHR